MDGFKFKSKGALREYLEGSNLEYLVTHYCNFTAMPTEELAEAFKELEDALENFKELMEDY